MITAVRGLLAAVTFIALIAPVAAQDLPDAANQNARRGSGDSVEHPLGKKQFELRQQGLQKLLKAQAQGSGDNKVVEVAKGQFVELARQGEDKIFTILGQFGTQIN